MVAVLAQLRIALNFRVVPAQAFAHGHGEATGAAGRIAHHIRGYGLGFVANGIMMK